MPPPPPPATPHEHEAASAGLASAAVNGPPPPPPPAPAASLSHPFSTLPPSTYSAASFRKDFFFRRRHGTLNWRKILSVDLERVVRTVDVDALQDNVESITFADVGEQDLAMLTDANFLQLFRLTQLIIEYLLNVQNFLMAANQKREAAMQEALRQAEENRARVDRREEQLRTMKRELKYCRRVIRAYERNMSSNWSHLTATTGNAQSATGPQTCGVCGSAFVNYDYLLGHYQRRHPDAQPPPPPPAVPAQPVAAQPAAQPTADLPSAQDFAAWKREMESALKAQLAEEARRLTASTAKPNSKTVDDKSELSKRLAKLESTLAAVLNSNNKALLDHGAAAAADTEASLARSRARHLRDDDGGARREEENQNLKEFFRRQLFDLAEEVRAIKDVRGGGGGAQAAAPTPLPPLEPEPSLRSSQHAQELLKRFRSMPTPLQPHQPSQPKPLAIPQGTETIPRHIPSTSPLHPSPPSSAKPTPLAISDSPDLMALRAAISEHADKRYELFPTDLPGLLARFPQSDPSIQEHMDSFELLSSTLCTQVRLNEVESEMRVMGYASLYEAVEAEVDQYVHEHYRRPQDIIEAHRVLEERELRNNALHQQWEEQRERERREQEEWIRQRQAMEEQVLRGQRERELEAQRLKQSQAEQQARARAEEQQLAQQLRQSHAQRLQDIQQGLVPTPSVSPSASPYPSPSPSPSMTFPSPPPLPYSGSSPSPYPLASPSMPVSTPSPSTFGAEGLARAQSLPSPSPSPPSAQLMSAAASLADSRPTTQRTGTTGNMQRPTPALKSLEESDEEEEEEEEKDPRTGQGTMVAAAASAPIQRQPSSRSTAAAPPSSLTVDPHAAATSAAAQSNPYSPPPAVPVPIPARPDKSDTQTVSTTAQSSTAVTSLQHPPPSSAAPAAAAVQQPSADNSDTVQPFDAEDDDPAPDRPSSHPIPSPNASPIPSIDSVGPPRRGARRLGNSQAEGGEQNTSPLDESDEDWIARKYSPGGSALTQLSPNAMSVGSGVGVGVGRVSKDRDGLVKDCDGGSGGPLPLERQEYEHSAARHEKRVEDVEHEFGGLDAPDDNDEVQGFSPPQPISRLASRERATRGRLHSDDEGEEEDESVGRLTTRFPSSAGGFNSSPPAGNRLIRNSGGVGSSMAPSGRFGGGDLQQQQQQQQQPAVNQSAKFSVTNSGDWKSDSDMFDDEIEELEIS